MGLPAVVGDSGGAPETVQDGVTGRVVDPRDPVQVSAAVLEMLDADDEVGVRGREQVIRSWTWTTASATLARLIGDVPSGNPETH